MSALSSERRFALSGDEARVARAINKINEYRKGRGEDLFVPKETGKHGKDLDPEVKECLAELNRLRDRENPPRRRLVAEDLDGILDYI